MFTFEARTAWDEAKQRVARGVTAQVFAYTDTEHSAPLPILDDTGSPIESGSLDSGPVGVFPGFKQPDHEKVLLWDGTYEVTLLSVEGRVGPPGDITPAEVDTITASLAGDPQSNLSGALNATFATNSYVQTLAYGTNLAATDQTVATWFPDENTATGAALAQQIAQGVAPKLDKSVAASTYATLDAQGREPVRKGELIFNVRDFGAVGDGITNDKVAIDAAMAAAGAATAFAPTVVWLPYTATGYGYDGEWSLQSGVTVRGENRVAIRLTAPSYGFIDTVDVVDSTLENLTLDANGNVTAAVMFIRAGAHRATIRNCRIKDTGVAGYGVDANPGGATDLLVEDCVFDGISGDNIRLYDNHERVTIRRNLFTNWAGRGIYVVSTATGSTEEVTIVDNEFRNMQVGGAGPRQPIAFLGPSDHRIVSVCRNRILGPGKSFTAADPGTADQISLYQCDKFEVLDNWSFDGGDMGITINVNCRNGKVSGNTCIGNDASGIFLGADNSAEYVGSITVHGNVCMNNGQNRNGDRGVFSRSGLWLLNASDMVTDANILGDDQGTKTQLYGVRTIGCSNVLHGVNVDAGVATGMYATDPANTNIREVATTTVVA